jgi:predicted RNase H-like HicB family nuclease
VSEVFAKFRGNRRDTADSLEIQRIVGLPIVEQPDEDLVEAFSREEVQAEHFDKGFRLFPTQVGGILAYDLYGGGLFPVGVGWGKTLISLKIADRAYLRGEAERILLVVPPQVHEQLVGNDIAQARKWVGLSVPFHLMGGKSKAARKRIAESRRVGCYITTYSLLSAQTAEDELAAMAPDLLILDEAHNVKNRTSARTRRLLRYMAANQPALVALSGTITSKSVKDYHHLISHALGDLSPLPRSETLADNWSYVLDPSQQGREGKGSKTGPLQPLVDWARANFPDEKIPEGTPGFRLAYKLRLTSCPGVVSTGDAEIGVSLTLRNEPVQSPEEAKGWGEMRDLVKGVQDLWRSPSGDEIEHGFHMWRYLYELAAGFYYHLRWPEIEELTARGRSEAEAADALEQALAHHEARQDYAKLLRRWIEYQGRPGMDTPLLVASNMAAHGHRDVGTRLYEAWREMKDLEFAGMPERISEPIRVCDYKVVATVKWAQALLRSTRGKEGGLVWFHHDAVGKWIFEALEDAGVPAIYCPSESKRAGSNEKILNQRNADKIVVASMGGHGTGKNLQHFRHQRFHQFPRQADLLEQVLGRTHRNGQQADELIPVTCNTTDFDHQNMFAALIDALYIHQTTGARQKAVYASYDPLPRQYPPDFLRERGFEGVKTLDAEGLRKLHEKFGS